MRAYSATVGATEGNIIAAIITTQTPTNQPRSPRSVPGPASMPAMRSAVDHQPTPPSARSTATSPSRARTATNAGLSPSRSAREATAGSALTSRGPGELRIRQTRLAFVLDAECVDSRALGFSHRQVRPHRMEHAVELDRLAALDAERDDVLDLEVDHVADPHAVAQPLVLYVERRPLGTERLA